MTGHTVVESKRQPGKTAGFPWRRIWFECTECDLRGDVRAAPPDSADALVADIIATHWGATGGDS